ncbi:MAG TPA: peroxiredoxin [Chthoniobacter sp.]|jgi:peroxiredoxin Q/BCP
MKLRTLLATLVSLSGLALFAHAAPLTVGSPAPAISGVDQDGKTINFTEVYAKGPTLVYFFPKADTPGCTKQGCSIRDSWADLTKAGIQVIGVSEDTVAAQKAFADKFHFPHLLIADHDGKVAAAFGTDFIANKPLTQRQSFLIKDGKVAWNMLKGTSTETHAQDVLKANAELSKK